MAAILVTPCTAEIAEAGVYVAVSEIILRLLWYRAGTGMRRKPAELGVVGT